jgi:aspartyl-tRNA(Asn)/glutamyl-tRNA(Gln) amidotransferase subunit A
MYIRLPPASKLSIKNLKIGIPREYHCENLDKEILETWNEIAKLLEQGGAIIKEVTCVNLLFPKYNVAI